MVRMKRSAFPLFLIVVFAFSFTVVSQVWGRDWDNPWTLRSNIVWLNPNSDWEPVDRLMGWSLSVLYSWEDYFRLGGEFEWITGEGSYTSPTLVEVSMDTNWYSLLIMGEFFFSPNDLPMDLYFNLGAGLIKAEFKSSGTVLGIPYSDSANDTDFVVKPSIGIDVFISRNVGVNIQLGYLWSEMMLDEVDVDAKGLEGKIGISLFY